MRNLLLVEPGIRAYKEHILEKLSKLPNNRLVCAMGLHELFDYSWVDVYSKEKIFFSYPKKNLLEAVLEFQCAHQIKFDGVITYVEPSLLETNELAHELQVPVLSGFRDRTLRNKGLARQRMADAKVVQPWFRLLSSQEDLEKLLKEKISFPLVIKPTEMMSSLGVLRVNSEEELRSAFEKVSVADFWDENLRKVYIDMKQEVLCEEYIHGQEFSVEVVVQNGNSRILGITEKTTTHDVFFDELSHYFPARDLSSDLMSRIQELIQVSHRALELKDTVTHTEIRIREGIPYIMEINCRLAGDMISALISKSTDANVGKILAQVALQEKVELPDLKRATPHSVQFITTPLEGRIVQDPKISCSPNSEIHCGTQPGEILFRDGLVGTSRLGFAIAPGKNLSVSILNETSFIQPLLAAEKLKSNEDTLLIFNVTEKELPELVLMEKETWEPELAASEATIRERFHVNPNGFFVGISLKTRKMEGFITAVPIASIADQECWEKCAKLSVDAQYIENELQNPLHIRSMHILNLTVHPKAARGTGTALVKGLAKHLSEKGFSFLHYGIRIPKFSKASEAGVSPEEYYLGLLSGKYHEDLFNLAKGAGAKPIKLMKNYYEDPASLNYAILVEHRLNGAQ